ncbi:HAD-IA family hydrolase [Candidatus Woesearchaeota archaeon]|nr:HAD-IA family hydrolase [Candidatus Woesearchaeota archaeon]
MIKAVLFDLDNTLVDFMRMKRASVEAAVEAMINAGLRMSKRVATLRLFKVYWRVGIEHPQIFQEFLKNVNHHVDDRIVAAGIVAYRKAQTAFLRPYPGMTSVLHQLKTRGLKLAIVSDAPRLKAWMRLTELGLQDMFDAVVAYDDTGERKPSTLPFAKALDQLNVRPVEVIHVGDWPERDVIGAKKLGIRAAWARYGWDPAKPKPRTHGADFVIDKPIDILRLVGKA